MANFCLSAMPFSFLLIVWIRIRIRKKDPDPKSRGIRIQKSGCLIPVLRIRYFFVGVGAGAGGKIYSEPVTNGLAPQHWLIQWWQIKLTWLDKTFLESSWWLFIALYYLLLCFRPHISLCTRPCRTSPTPHTNTIPGKSPLLSTSPR